MQVVTDAGHPCRPFIAIFSLWLLLCPAARAQEDFEGGNPIDGRILEAVFVVESGTQRGLGFLVDDSGLIVTGHRIGLDTPHVIVHLDEQHRVMAQALVHDGRSLTAILRVAPEAVAGVEPLVLPPRRSRSRPRKEDRLTVIRGPEPGHGPREVPARLTRAWGAWLAHDAPAALEDVGGPVLDARGMVLGVAIGPTGKEGAVSSAVPIWMILPVLKDAREEAARVEPPPAGVWLATGSRGATGEATRGPGDHHRNPGDYRIRLEKVNLEFLTPPVVHSLLTQASFPSVVGEAPWQWQRFGPLSEPVVILQVVPDLRWTGGSYVRVTGRVVSYPILAGFVAGMTLFFSFFALLAGGGDIPDFITPTAPLWKPARAAYHFKGDFLQASLLRDGVEVSPINALRNCATTEVWISRNPSMKPRWRKVRGCWGSYSYPVQAFAPEAALEVRLTEEGKEETPRVVPLSPDLVARVRADFPDPPAQEDGP